MTGRSSAQEPPPTTASLLAIAAGRPLHPVVFVIVVGALTALGPFTMDLYLPAFPSVQASLDTTSTAVQLTLTATAVGLGVGQLLVGPLSDAVGRRLPLISATGLHVLASVVIAAAPTIEVVTAARFAQGFGAAAGAVVAAAMLRDLFGGKRLVKMAARIALISGLAPIVAPIAGSQLLLVTDWRGVFVLLAVFGALVMGAVIVLTPETLPASRRSAERRPWAQRVSALIRDRAYVGTVVVGALIFSGIVSYLTASPFIFQNDFGLSEQEYGFIFAFNALGLFTATQLSARLLRRVRPAVLLAAALPALLISGVAFAVVGATGSSWEWAVGASFILVALHGFSGPCVTILLLAHHRTESGTAIALSGFANSVLGGVISLLPAALGGVGATSLGFLVVGLGLTAIVVMMAVVRPRSASALTHD